MNNESGSPKFQSEEERHLASEEASLSDPKGLNMQLLQKTLNTRGLESASGADSIPNIKLPASGSANPQQPLSSPATLHPVMPVGEALATASAGALATQAAAAAPVTMGRNPGAGINNPAALPAKVLAGAETARDPVMLLAESLDSQSDAALRQLMAILDNPQDLLEGNLPADSLLFQGAGSAPGAGSIEEAIARLNDRIDVLNQAFEPVFDGLAQDVADVAGGLNQSSSRDLAVTINETTAELGSVLGVVSDATAFANTPLEQILDQTNLTDELSEIIDLIVDPVIGDSNGGLNIPDADLDQINSEVLNPIVDPVVDAVDGVVEDVVDAVDPVVDVVDGVVEDVVDAVDPVVDVVEGVVEDVVDAVDPVVDVVDGVIEDVVDAVDPVVDVVEGVVGDVVDAVDPVVDVVEGVVEDVVDAVDPVVDVVDGVVEDVLDAVDPVVDVVDGVVEDLVDPVVDAVDPVVDVVTDLLDPVVDVLDPVTEPVVDVVTDLLDPVVDALDPVVDPVIDLVDNLTGGDQNGDGGLLDVVTDVGEGLLGGLGGGLGLLGDSSAPDGDGALTDLLTSGGNSGISTQAGNEEEGSGGVLGGLL